MMDVDIYQVEIDFHQGTIKLHQLEDDVYRLRISQLQTHLANLEARRMIIKSNCKEDFFEIEKMLLEYTQLFAEQLKRMRILREFYSLEDYREIISAKAFKVTNINSK